MNEKNARRGAPIKPDNEKHSERLGEIRVMAAQLENYLLAAELEGKSKSDWVRDTLDAQARRTIKKHRKL
ncbi:hypothetical protein E4188_22240 (plasmid) [Aeromonas media]|uniref:CopG family transcriptional regulator n=1 Tax=Aeromonas media TaxID=651 RepID=A0ABX6NXV7_AERME|nr:hypothetical protein [Aeromonas media]QJT37013.1 hypothetical protein E4187_22225 [Aeromonas media]QJT41222.1 hypothetical protein E4188_22240 [Aeromonas media]